MDTYVILRRSGWKSPEDLEKAAARSTEEGDKMPDAIRKHAGAADLPVDEVIKVVDMVKVREGPS